MSGPRWAGLLWFAAALIGVVVTVGFRAEQLQWIVTIIAGIAAAVVAVLLIWRPLGRFVIWSTAVGVGWFVVYAGLTILQREEVAAWATDVFVGALGVAAASVAYRQRKVAPRP